MDPRVLCRTREGAQHRLGRGCRCQVGPPDGTPPQPLVPTPIFHSCSRLKQQCRSCGCGQQGPLLQLYNQQGSEANLPHPGLDRTTPCCRAHCRRAQCIQPAITRRHCRVLTAVPCCSDPYLDSIAQAAQLKAAPICIMSMRMVASNGPPGSKGALEEFGHLTLRPSPLQPDCQANKRIFQWRGVVTQVGCYYA
jgi:hypothetical protein